MGGCETRGDRECHCRRREHEVELGEEDDIVEWLMAHSNQDESGVGETGEDHSAVPRAIGS